MLRASSHYAVESRMYFFPMEASISGFMAAETCDCKSKERLLYFGSSRMLAEPFKLTSSSHAGTHQHLLIVPNWVESGHVITRSHLPACEQAAMHMGKASPKTRALACRTRLVSAFHPFHIPFCHATQSHLSQKFATGGVDARFERADPASQDKGSSRSLSIHRQEVGDGLSSTLRQVSVCFYNLAVCCLDSRDFAC